MSTVLIGLALLVLAVLLVVDLVIMRGADRYDDAQPEPKDRVWAKDTPPVVKGGAYVSLVLGALSFPGTLAPVVMTVLAFQKHPVLSDGWISLVAVIVAGLSMSAAVKCFRASHLLRHFADEMRALLLKTLIFLGLWAALVLLLMGLMRAPTGNLALLIWGYVALNTLGIGAVAAAIRTGLLATAPAGDEPSEF